jgi:hypothetical protein
LFQQLFWCIYVLSSAWLKIDKFMHDLAITQHSWFLFLLFVAALELGVDAGVLITPFVHHLSVKFGSSTCPQDPIF